MSAITVKQAYAKKANRIIRNHVLVSMGLAFVPLPLIDLALISGVQLKMIHALSRLYGVSFRKQLGKSLLSTLVGGTVTFTLTRPMASLIKTVPGVGSAAGAVSLTVMSGASTYAIGQVFKAHFSCGGTLDDFDPVAMRSTYQAKLREGEQIAKKLQRQKNAKKRKNAETTTQKLPFYKRWWGKKTPSQSKQSVPPPPLTVPQNANPNVMPTPQQQDTPRNAPPNRPQPKGHNNSTPVNHNSNEHPASAPVVQHTSSPQPHQSHYHPNFSTLADNILHTSPVGFPIVTSLIMITAIIACLVIGAIVLHDRLIAPHYPNLHAYIHQHLLPAEQTLYVALIGPMSGEYQVNGEEMRRGVQLRVSELNKKGGIHGKYVKVLVYDDGNDPQKAADIAREVVANENVLAVIGHYTSPVSLAAATVYQVSGMPAITGSATTDQLTQDNDWYFRIIFNDSLQAALAANYLYKVLEQQQADVIYVKDTYGKSLAKAFVKTAKQIGLQINTQWETAPDRDSVRQLVSRLTAALESESSDNQRAIFLAVHSNQAPPIIRALRPFKDRLVIMGGDAISSSGFMQEIQKYPQERTMPGYYSDNIYAISPFLNGLASRRAQFFRLNFWSHYQKEPSIASAMYYDAAMVTLQAIENSRAWQADTIEARRKAVQEGLWQFADIETAVEGVTGYNYFNADGDVVKTIPVGVYHNGRPMTALEQFQPFSGLDEHEALDLFEAALDNQVISVAGYLMRRSHIVYTGIHFNEIDVLDVEHNTFKADFFLWFRFQNKDFLDTDLNFTTLDKFIKPLGKPIIDQTATLERDAIVRTYHIKGAFRFSPNYQEYPLDIQALPISFHHQNLTRDQLLYVVDAVGMGFSDRSGSVIIDELRRHQAFTTDHWQLKRMFFYQDLQIYDSSLGLPTRIINERPLEYSQFNIVVEIERQFQSVMTKYLLPVGLMMMLGYLTFFLPVGNSPIRVLLGIGILLMMAIFHLQMHMSLPNVSYPVFLEYMFYLGYILAIFVILIAALINYKYRHSHTHAGHMYDIRRLKVLGKLLYPAIITVWMMVIMD